MLRAGDAVAAIALSGAEPVRWQVGGRDLLWSGDPAHWGFSAPILFPVVGASAGGVIRVDGKTYPMPQHGFARHARFAVTEQSDANVRLRLTDTAESRAAYPFRFALDVSVALEARRLILSFAVANRGDGAMPYALGFHPAFPWPFDAADRADHVVTFDQPERPDVPEVAPGGLLARTTRTVPLDGRVLPLDPALFTEALVFLDARSRGFSFVSPTGAAIRMETDHFSHIAVWTKPTAPFLSLECWTGHADFADADGALADRASIRLLSPGGVAQHRTAIVWTPAAI